MLIKESLYTSHNWSPGAWVRASRQPFDASLAACLKSREIGFNGPSQKTARLERAAGLLRCFPPVLVDATKQTVGFAACSKGLDDFQQSPFCLLGLSKAIERESESLRHRPCPLQRLGNARVEIDHLRMAADVTERKKKIDDRRRIDIYEVGKAGLGRDGAHRDLAAPARQRKPILESLGLINAGGKYQSSHGRLPRAAYPRRVGTADCRRANPRAQRAAVRSPPRCLPLPRREARPHRSCTASRAAARRRTEEPFLAQK